MRRVSEVFRLAGVRTVLVFAAAVLVTGMLARAERRPPGVKLPAKAKQASPAPASSPGSAPASAALAGDSASQRAARRSSGHIARLTPEAGQRGWKLFFEKQCVKCHSIWGRGSIGPDLGRAQVGKLSEGEVAARLWNSIPRMWAKMEQLKVTFAPISKAQMNDIFSFLFYLRYVDAPGDVREGRITFLRSCQSCHQLSGDGGKIGPDLARWSRHANPVVWSAKMWSAAPQMQKEMQRRGIKWPTFAPGEMNNLVALIRSVAPAREKTYLELGSAQVGLALLRAKKCAQCHSLGDGPTARAQPARAQPARAQPARAQPGGPPAGGGGGHAGAVGAAPDLSSGQVPANVTDLAAAMWNHAPQMLERMRKQGVRVADIQPQEMAHIAAYVLSLRYNDKPGDAERGKTLFSQRGCVKCHADGTATAPALAKMRAEETVAHFTYVMWNKGRAMLKEMAQQGQAWPILSRAEILDLLAYLMRPRPGVAPRSRQ